MEVFPYQNVSLTQFEAYATQANESIGRLPEVIIGGVAFSGGLFWFGWTGNYANVHWIVPTLSGLLSGFGLMAIFLQSLNYLVDAYLMFAASAIAANTFLRSLCGAGFPLFATYMFDGMGINWASTLLGCVAAILVPVPVWFWLKGGKIREKSAFAPTNMPGLKPPQVSESTDEEKGEKGDKMA
jgi:DHA1 family multidrug resistance protein-like MFS transporter